MSAYSGSVRYRKLATGADVSIFWGFLCLGRLDSDRDSWNDIVVIPLIHFGPSDTKLLGQQSGCSDIRGSRR
jgi:hypothetical protein